MAGPTVASRATKTVLARLGRKNVHRENLRPGDEGTRGASPLTAVWAIVQAYAIVALVLTAYNSVFASDAGVPDAVQDQHDSFKLVKDALFGDGVLADVYNLDRFLGVSSTSHHLTRLACRKSLDAVAGTGWVAQKAAWYAVDTSAPLARDFADAAATELQLDVAWAKIAASAKFTWRNTKNVAFLSWTIVKPAVVFVLPFWDFIWDGLEPVFGGAKDAVVDSAEDAYFTLEESIGEELGPTFRRWALASRPVYMFPVNVYRFFVATVVRPAVYFCTYPELRGDLEIPEAPALERLRWGEKCRKTLWSDWGPCSARCGSGYRARVNHCGTREIVRCDGPGVMGCDEVCDSGATRDCAGRCRGTDTVDCRGVCGGSSAFGCDGKCRDPPAQKDDKGACCVSPTFVLQTTGLCNTTADPQTEMLAEAARLKRRLAEAKARLVAGGAEARRDRRRHKSKAERKQYEALEALAADVAIADANAGLTPSADYLLDLEETQLKAEEEAELRAAKRELAEKMRQREALLRKQKALAAKRANQRSWGKAIAMFPVDLVAFATKTTFSRWGVLAAFAGAFVATLSAAVSYSFRKLERDLTKDADEDDDAESVVSVGGKARRAFEAVSAKVAELRKMLEKPEKKPEPEKERRYADAGTSNVTAKAAAKLSGRAAETTGAEKQSAKSAEAIHADLYLARRRCLSALVNMSADNRLDWRRRLRCHAALLRLAAKGGGRPFLVASLGAPGSAAAAMDLWVERKTKGDGKPMLQPGPDAALQLLRVLATSASPGVARAMRDAEVVASGSAAHTLLDVLAETPGVLQVQHAGLATLWALLRLGARAEAQLEKRLIDRGLFEHCQDEWEDSKEDEGVAHGIGGVVMQLAANGDADTRAGLTRSGAQALVSAVFAKHPGVSYKGAFASLKPWLREKP
jgi:hypothetical protein